MGTLKRYKTPLIIVRVADRVPGKIATLARYVDIRIPQTADGDTNPAVELELTLHEINGETGVLGPALYGQGFKAEQAFIRSDGVTLVDEVTGGIVRIVSGETPDFIDALVEAYPGALMWQNEHFGQLRDETPVLLGPLIRNNILQADAMGRFSPPPAPVEAPAPASPPPLLNKDA